MRALRLMGLVLILAIWVGALAISSGKEIRVPQDYQTIQEAIDAATEGDTILVDVGTYKENLRIPKGLTLIGADREQTIIEGGGNDVIAIFSASLVTVRNFTITGGRDGVSIARGAQTLLRGNRILQNRRDGVLVIGSTELLGNFIADNGRCGVQVFGASAKVSGSGNIIQNNAGGDLCGNIPEGIKAMGGPPAPTLIVTPKGWTNRNEFTLDWELPDYAAAIVAAWYKIGSVPTGPEDGTRTTEKPLSLQSPAEGRTPVWVWLEDELGQKDHKNAAQGFLLLDQTKPAITATIDPRPNAHGWNNKDVTVRFDCRDALSDIASCTEPIVITEEVKGRIVKGEAVDKAGNRAETSVTINLDKTKPWIQVGDPQGNLGNEGWYLTDVAVTFFAEDNLSGFPNGQLKLEETKHTSGEGEDLRLHFAVEDLADNRAEAQAGPFKVDKTPPQAQILLDPSAPDGQNGWYIHPVAVRYVCTDAVSGVSPETPCPPQKTISEDGIHELRLTVKDRAGHTNSDSKVVKLDQTPPEVKCQVPDTDVWYADDVAVRCSASDVTSGLADPEDASFTLTASGEGRAVSTGSREIRDQAGNSSIVGPFSFKIDKTPPTIKAQILPEPNPNGWNNAITTVHFICEDKLSGIASCTPDQRLDTEGKGQKVVGEAVDRAGHRATARVEVNIDMTPPEITLGQPQGTLGNEGWYRSDVRVLFTATDKLAGFAPDGRPVLEGSRSTSGEGANLMVKITIEDLAGNTAEAQAGPFKVDKTPPQAQILLDPSAPDGQNGWYIHPVAVRYVCTDAVSGVSPETPCPPQKTISEDGIHELRLTVKDRAGHTNSDSKVVKLDQTPPEVKCQVPDTDVWYADDVAVRCSASDVTSGLADPEDASFTLTASGEGRAVSTGSREIRDQAGNSSIVGPFSFKIDKTPPDVQILLDPPDPNGQNGWYTQPVIVKYECHDALSGLDPTTPCPPGTALTDDGIYNLNTGIIKDRAGNSNSAFKIVKLDWTPPKVECQIPDPNIWYSEDVIIVCTASDATSGLAEPRDASFTLKATGEGVAVTTDSREIFDQAGNLSVAGPFSFKIDKTSPTIKAMVSPEPNPNGWNNTDVTVSFDCQDGLSGIASCTEPVTLSTEGKDQLVQGEAIDKAGNRATVQVKVNIDKTKPVIEGGEPRGVPGQEGWYISDVTVSFLARDNLAGFAPDGALTKEWQEHTRGEGAALTITASIADLAGNEQQATVGPFKVDKTPPTIEGQISPQPNVHGWNNTDVAVSFVCTDEVSGVASCPEPVALTKEGKDQPVEVTATDKAGNSATTRLKVSIDKTPPKIEFSQESLDGSLKVSWRVEDTLSGIKSCKVYVDDRYHSNLLRGSYTFTPGPHTVRIEAEDYAGNSSAESYELKWAFFDVIGVTVKPSKPIVNEPATIEAIIENTGNMKGTDQVSLYIDGHFKDSRTLTLEPGSRGSVSFSYTFTSARIYRLEIKTSNDSYSTPVHVITRPPYFDVYNLSISPSKPKVGEPVSITATVKNTGGSRGRQEIRLLVNRARERSQWLTLSPGESQTVRFSYTFLSSGDYIVRVASDDDYEQSSITVVPPLPQREGFESGDFSALPWQTGGDAPWEVVSDEKHSGNYSAKAGEIEDFEKSYLKITLTVKDGYIRFFRKVSSEPCCDFLKFYIDGKLQDKWAGARGWWQFEYFVRAGTHTFEWIYAKDPFVSMGKDTAWIDDIEFPPIVGP